jgi:PAS domain S-box-containing protein
MTVRKKSLLLVVTVLFFTSVSIYTFLHFYITRELARAETLQVGGDLERLKNILDYATKSLDVQVADWAGWDDLCLFVNGERPEFLTENLSIGSFQSNKTNLVAIANLDGEIVFGRLVDFINKAEQPLPDSFKGYLTPGGVLTKFSSNSDSVHGLFRINGNPYIISSRPILASSRQGASHGTLVMGRIIDKDFIEGLEGLAHLPIKLLSLEEAKAAPELAEVCSSFISGAKNAIRFIDKDHIEGFAILRDVEGTPIYLLRTETPRVFLAQSIGDRRSLMIGLTLTSIVACIVVLLLLDRFLLIRCASLNRFVSHVSAGEGLASRFPVRGGDEIATLGLSVNRMLDRIERGIEERTRAEEAELNAKRRYEDLLRNLPIGVYRRTIGPDGRFTDVNRAHMAVLEAESEQQLIDYPVLSLYKDPEEYTRFCQDLIRDGAVKDREIELVTLKGETIWVSITAASRRDDDGSMIVDGVLEDISKRKRAELDLRESEQQKAAILNGLKDVLVQYLDEDLNILWTNGGLSASSAPSLGNRLSGRCYEIIKGLSKPCLDCSALRAFQSGHPEEGEVIMQDGRVWITRSNPVRDASGKVSRVINIAFDITRRKRAEENLRQSEMQYRALFEGALAAIFIVDANSGVLLDANLFAQQLVGLTRESIIGVHMSQLYPANERERFQGLIQAQVASMDFSLVSLEVEKSDGARVPVEACASLVSWTKEQPVLQIVMIDVTERKLAEDALRESEAKFRTISMSAQDAIVMLEQDGGIAYWNPAAEKILGYASEEIIGVNLSQILVPARSRGVYGLAAPRWDALAKNKRSGEILEIAAWKRNGEQIDAEVSISSVKMGKRWQAICILRDVTNRKRAESELLLAKEAAEALNRELSLAIEHTNLLVIQAQAASQAKSQFVANMSHEIRTPLNGVIGMTGLLLDTELTDEQKEFACVARAAAETLLSVVNDILDFSKVEAGKLEIETLDFDLRLAVEEAVEVLAFRAHEKGLEFNCLVHGDVPSLLRGDPGRLRQILLNLSNNAIKFTEHGEVILSAVLEEEDDDQVRVRFAVTDTGIGIPADRLEGLFQSFTQVDASTTRRYGGTGLGLAISKQLCEIMGGDIGVKSEVGIGSAFWFVLPFEKQKGIREAPLPMSEALEGRRILVVDDNLTNRAVLREQLRGWGCVPQEAVDATSALDMLREAAALQAPFEVAILDMAMPDMDGLMLGREIKSDPNIAAVQLIMLTSRAQRGDAKLLSEAGFMGYLPKPAKRSHLHDCLLMALTPDADVKAPTQERTLITRHILSEERRRRVRILLAEDNITNQKVATRVLARLGYRVEAVANGIEAVEAIKSIPYDLILMDVQMPEMDGMEATARIRRLQEGSKVHTPIIAMTAHAMKGDREACIAAGMDDYVAKPIDPDALAAAIERQLGDAEIAAPREMVSYTPSIVSASTASSVAQSPSAGTPAVEPWKIFDLAALDRRLGGDLELLHEVIGIFVEDVPGQIERLFRFCSEGDAQALLRQAHTLKGAAANVSAIELSATAYAVEQAARAEDFSTAAGLIPTLYPQFDVFREAVAKLDSVA